MRIRLPALALLALASPLTTACTPLHMRGPDAPPETMEERLLTGIGYRNSGRFALAEVEGTFVRGDGAIRSGADLIHEGDAEFALAGPGVDGRVGAACAYSAVDTGGTNIGIRTQPVSYRCAFTRNGEPIDARLELTEVPSWGDRREGLIFYRGRRISLRSVNKVKEHSIPMTIVGYVLSEDDRDIGGIDLLHSDRKVFLPKDPAIREAAIVASVAIAVFRDVNWSEFDREPDAVIE